jgi:hydrogenase nickel incorporation protein HypB
MKVAVVKNILEANQRIAAENRQAFDERGLLVINLMSSPGAGKTTLLEKTIQLLKEEWKVGVVEGDIQSTYDAERIGKTGAPVVQINTGGACHLDSNMVREALKTLELGNLNLLFIENVGNLVCPAEFQLGEHFKAMILSVAEGDDKPLKYPLMFQESRVLLINKIDLLPFCDCNVNLMEERARAINPSLQIFRVSCRTGEGLEGWISWLRGEMNKQGRS